MHRAIVAAVAAVALITSAGVCFAQPAGVTREMIARALPVEGAPLAEPGPNKVTSEVAFGSPGHRVFYPTTLDAFPKKDTLPVMVWGNGGCAIDSTRYSGFLTTIASHGFQSRRDVRWQELQPLHKFELGRAIERDQAVK